MVVGRRQNEAAGGNTGERARQWSSQVPWTTAGPRDRAGLMLVPVIGIPPKWATKTAVPIAAGARLAT